MNLRVLALLFIPSFALAEPHPCHMMDPHSEPAGSIQACTDFLAVDNPRISDRADALTIRGIARRELEQFGESVQDLEASLALVPDTSTMRMLAWTYRQMGHYRDAEALLTNVLRQDRHWQGWLSRCVVRQDSNRFDEALEDCQEALRQDAQNVDALHFTARAYSFLDKPAEALPLAARATELAPDDPRHVVEYVWALHQLGSTVAAREHANKALARFPAHSDLLHFLRESE